MRRRAGSGTSTGAARRVTGRGFPVSTVARIVLAPAGSRAWSVPQASQSDRGRADGTSIGAGGGSGLDGVVAGMATV